MQLLKNSEVCRMVGISRTTLWRLVRDGTFPNPLKISSMTRRWPASEVEAWMRSLSPAKPELIPNAKLAETEGNTVKQQKRQKRKPPPRLIDGS